MRADVGLSPAVQTWTDTALTHFSASAWDATPPSPRETMHASDHHPSVDPRLSEAQLDFFHKLGYSRAQVLAVQQKFGPTIDTDKVLGELVRHRAGREARWGPVTTVSTPVTRGDAPAGGPMLLMPVTGSSGLSSEQSSEDGDALRAIVIDGSNVAMRWEEQPFSVKHC